MWLLELLQLRVDGLWRLGYLDVLVDHGPCFSIWKPET